MHTVRGVRNVKGLEVLKLKPHLEKWVISSAIVFRFVIINPTSPSLYSPGQKHDLELLRMDLVFWQAPIGLFTLCSVNDSFLTGLIVMFS